MHCSLACLPVCLPAGVIGCNAWGSSGFVYFDTNGDVCGCTARCHTVKPLLREPLSEWSDPELVSELRRQVELGPPLFHSKQLGIPTGLFEDNP